MGTDDITIQRGVQAIAGTDEAWGLYFRSQANEAVSAFGAHKGGLVKHIRHQRTELTDLIQEHTSCRICTRFSRAS